MCGVDGAFGGEAVKVLAREGRGERARASSTPPTRLRRSRRFVNHPFRGASVCRSPGAPFPCSLQDLRVRRLGAPRPAFCGGRG